MSRHFSFQKEAGIVTASDVILSGDDEEDREIGAGLSDEEKYTIIIEMFEGRRHWLDQEGSAGDVARHLDYNMTFSNGELGANDIDTLRMVLNALQQS